MSTFNGVLGWVLMILCFVLSHNMKTHNTTISTGKLFIIEDTSYKCSVIKTLKEDK